MPYWQQDPKNLAHQVAMMFIHGDIRPQASAAAEVDSLMAAFKHCYAFGAKGIGLYRSLSVMPVGSEQKKCGLKPS